MSTVQFSRAGSVAPDAVEMTPELEQLHASIVERLERAGVQLPGALLASVADEILADAVRISLLWLENG
jgi:hypothetical protein